MIIEHAQIIMERFPTKFNLVITNNEAFNEIKFATLKELKEGIDELYKIAYSDRPEKQTTS